MSRISILPDALADKIAAGEVVQRPASVVKELVENSIDAGATAVTVLVREAGRSLISVTDDGSGMDRADAELSLRRHATSKISTADDLLSIRSLGFRGEALAAIASVSRMEIRTRTAGEEIGTVVTSEAGKVTGASPAACPPGTTVSVKQLFYNVPGRRKFLKSNPTEYRHIADAFQRLALARPDVAFSLSHDDAAGPSFAAATPEARVRQMFGDEESERLVPIETSSGSSARAGTSAGAGAGTGAGGGAGVLSVSGFISTPAYARKGRAEQFLILNGRPVSSRSLAHAVFSGYERLLEKGSFPLSVIYITIDPRAVDVNVHPQKLEVKFVDESSVYRAVHGAVKRALSEHVMVADLSLGPDRAIQGAGVLEAAGPVAAGTSARISPAFALPKTLVRETLFGGERRESGGAHDTTDAGFPASPKFPAQPSDLSDSSVHGPGFLQIHDKYIMARTETGVMIVDQHAAHERILYERAVARFEQGAGPSQDLLFPIVLKMPPGDVALAAELEPLFGSLGFRLRPFGPDTWMLDGIPMEIPPGSESAIIGEVLAGFRGGGDRSKLEPRERLARSYSCRAAVKSGQKLAAPEMKRLIEDLLATDTPSVCPHGRPVMINLTLDELDRRFGRTPPQAGPGPGKPRKRP